MDRDDPWSTTDREIHGRLHTLRETSTAAAVATVVDVEGSAYCRPGAKLLAPSDDDVFGAITAGCLEGTVADLAADARDTGTASVETSDRHRDEHRRGGARRDERNGRWSPPRNGGADSRTRRTPPLIATDHWFSTKQ